MTTKLMLALATLAVWPATSLAVSTAYSYTGLNYDSVWDHDSPAGSYTTDMRVTGSIRLLESLVPDTHTVLIDADPKILSLSFSDGRIAYDLGNIASGTVFTLDTDSSGAIAAWSVILTRNAPLPDTSHSVLNFISNCGGVGCDVSNLWSATGGNAEGGVTNTAGIWTVTPVPETTTCALFLAGIAVVGFAAKRRMRLPR